MLRKFVVGAVAAAATAVALGQVNTLVLNSTPLQGDPTFRDTHTTFDLMISTPDDWLASEMRVDVVGNGIIWNSPGEQGNIGGGDTTANGGVGVPFVPDAGGLNINEFDTFVNAPPAADDFFVNPSLATPGGDPVAGPTTLHGWGATGNEIPLAWFDITNMGPMTFIGARITFEHPVDQPLSLDPAAGPLFATIVGRTTWAGNPQGESFSFNIYQVPEPASLALLALGGLLGLRRR